MNTDKKEYKLKQLRMALRRIEGSISYLEMAESELIEVVANTMATTAIKYIEEAVNG